MRRDRLKVGVPSTKYAKSSYSPLLEGGIIEDIDQFDSMISAEKPPDS